MSTFVLVHGAWAGSWVWRKVRPLLLRGGNDVYVPSLTGQGERSHLAGPSVNLTTHVQDVVNTLFYEDLHDVVLVGHSYGGMVVTGVANDAHERIGHLVYLDAFLPNNGQSLADIGGPAAPPAGDWRLPPMGGGPPPANPNDPEMLWARAHVGPQPWGTFSEKVRLSRPLERYPFTRSFVLALGRDGQGPFEKFAVRVKDNPAWLYREINGGHNMMISNPVELAMLLLELAKLTMEA
ncbi:MAG TPA: alpha/beta hydrolase [Chloroflexota bacterium]|nr:alpha/beta hydrolase [Chloroflexota bacterium]